MLGATSFGGISLGFILDTADSSFAIATLNNWSAQKIFNMKAVIAKKAKLGLSYVTYKLQIAQSAKLMALLMTREAFFPGKSTKYKMTER